MYSDKRVTLVGASEPPIDQLSRELKREGFQIGHKDSYKDLLISLPQEQPDLVMVDMMMSGWPGFDLFDIIRTQYSGPLIALTTKEDDVDHVLSLSMGADDYIPKQINTKVLVARIKALLRRTRPMQSPRRMEEEAGIKIGDLLINLGRREVLLKQETIELTAFEFDLLHFLATKAGSVVSRDEIHMHLYNSRNQTDCRAIDMYISRIRKKIGDAPFRPQILKTVRGAGYLLMDSTFTNCDKTATK